MEATIKSAPAVQLTCRELCAKLVAQMHEEFETRKRWGIFLSSSINATGQSKLGKHFSPGRSLHRNARRSHRLGRY